MNESLLKDIVRRVIDVYFFGKDAKSIQEYFEGEHTSLISLGGKRIMGADAVLAFLAKKRALDPQSVLADTSYTVYEAGAEHAVMIGEYVFNRNGTDQEALHMHITFCFVREETGVRITHMHISSPGYSTYLDKRIQQIQLIAEATASGFNGCVDDEQFTYFYVSNELCRMLGYTHDEFMAMSGGTGIGAIYPPDVPRVREEIARGFLQGDTYRVEYRIRHKDGRLMCVMETGKRVQDDDRDAYINSIITDISELKNTVHQLQIEKERSDIVAELAGDIIFDYDLHKDRLQILYPYSFNGERKRIVFPQFKKNKGFSMLGVSMEDNRRISDRIWDMEKQENREAVVREEYSIKHGDEVKAWRRVLMRGILDEDGKLMRLVGKSMDVTDEKRLVLKSSTDVLTGAYNRAYLEREITRYLKEKNGDVHYACLLIDVDYFKDINDRYGHLQGDAVLAELVRLLKIQFRNTDVVARIGGDEFMVFMKDICSLEAVKEKANKLIMLARRMDVNTGVVCGISLSIGIALSKGRCSDFKVMYHLADVALYQAKREGRGRISVYEGVPQDA